MDFIVIFFNFLQPSNAREEILAIPFPMDRADRETHLEKHAVPMDCTESGILTVLRFLQFEKALFPMAATWNLAFLIRMELFTVRERTDDGFLAVPIRVTVLLLPVFVTLYFMPSIV